MKAFIKSVFLFYMKATLYESFYKILFLYESCIVWKLFFTKFFLVHFFYVKASLCASFWKFLRKYFFLYESYII